MTPLEDPCGPHSRHQPDVRPLFDARGIYCTNVCPKCEAAKRATFRPEIFEDAGYDTLGDDIEADHDSDLE